MSINFYKKIISLWVIFSLLFSYIDTYAVTTLTPVVNKNLQTIDNSLQIKKDLQIYNPQVITKTNLWGFSVNATTSLNKETLYLTWITSANAWKVLKTWSVDSNFNKNFVVKPSWSNYDFLVMKLDKQGLDEALERTSLAKETYSKYKNISWWIWQLETLNPTLEMLPDRLVLTSKIQIKFKTKTELENIKKYYKLNNANIFKSLSTKKELENTKEIFEEEDTWFKKENSYKYLYTACLKDITCKTKLAEKLWITSSAIQKRAYIATDNQLIEEVFFDESEESIIEQEEIIAISLIPTDPLATKTFYNNLKLDPKSVRITSTSINNIFVNIEKVSKISKELVTVWQNKNISDSLKNICKSYTSSSEKAACEKLASEYLNPKNKNYEKILINGITIWNEYSYAFKSKWKKWGVVVYSIDVWVDFGFGFGIRIPIKAKVDISKSPIQVWATLLDKKFNASIQVQTIDATADQYRDAWIVSSQLFDWKEFVFKVYATLHWKFVLVDNTVFNKTYDLIEMLWELLGIDWLHSFDKSINFTPPFAWTNTLNLINEEYGIKVYKKSYGIWGWTLYADILFQAYIDWYIKAYCKSINSSSNLCNKTLEFRSFNPQELQFEAKINNSELKDDLLWQYNEYGLILEDFQYIPQLVSFIKSRARLHYRYDIYIHDGSDDISTPRYEIFKYTIDLPALWAHTWYWVDWQYSLTEEQKQLKATDNKIYSKLKQVIASNLTLVFPEFKPLLNNPSFVIPWKNGILILTWSTSTSTWSNLDDLWINEDSGNEDIGNTETETEEEAIEEDTDNTETGEEDTSNTEIEEEISNIETEEEWIWYSNDSFIIAANNLASKWIIVDHSSNTEQYNLKQNVLRQEIANISRKLAWIDKFTKCKNIFSDLSIKKPNNWACLSIEPLVEKGILSRNSTFRPESNITKTEVLKMIIKSSWLDYYFDSKSSQNWQEQIVDYAVNKWLINNFTDYNTFATRWWIFEMTDKILWLE